MIDMRYKGSSFMEYAIVLGIASLVLVGMNTYIKRGLQCKIKDMTDYFIGKEQVVNANPTTQTTSQSKSAYSSNVDTQGFIGGGMRTLLSDKADIEAASRTIDTDMPYVEKDFVPAEAGYVGQPAGEASDAGTEEKLK